MDNSEGINLDLDAILLEDIFEAYVKRFGPLPEELMMNDIVWHVCEMIRNYKEAA